MDRVSIVAVVIIIIVMARSLLGFIKFLRKAKHKDFTFDFIKIADP